MGQLLLLFLSNFYSFSSYAGAILVVVTNLFSSCYWLIYFCYSAKNARTICHNLFDLYRSSKLPEKRWYHRYSNRGWLKWSQSHFHQAIPHKSHHYSLFWCSLCTTIQDISSSNENINNSARVFKLSFRFLWLWISKVNLFLRISPSRNEIKVPFQQHNHWYSL